MCGLFGMVHVGCWSGDRCDRATEAILMLGLLAEERGTDAAGLAMRAAVGTASQRTPRADIARFADVRVDSWRVVKTRGTFSDLDQPTVIRDLRKARLVLGHTRWSTQGADRMVNASPLVVGSILGTHNGDVSTTTLAPMVDERIRIVGDTDTEVLLAALASTDGTAEELRAVLENIEGRAALAWVDRSRPHGVWLARAALSPLAVAGDGHGGLWWASNPEWLRRIEQHFRLGLGKPRMLREGTLLRVRGRNGGLDAQIAPPFVPLARARDRRLAELAVWRGFTRSDKASDKAQLRNKLVASSVSIGRAEPGWSSVEPDTTDWPIPREPRWDDRHGDDWEWDVA